MTMNVLNAVAQFERGLLSERTQSDLRRAKSEGKALGRRSTLSEGQRQDVREDLAAGASILAMARKFATSRQIIMGLATTVHDPFELRVSAGTNLVPAPSR